MRSLLVAAIFMVPLLILGMFGNLHLMYATLKFKELQHRNGLLVAIIASFDFVSELFETKNAIEIFIGQSLMKRVTCYNSIFLYGYSFNMACVAILFLAIDRLIAVWLPVKYRQMNSTRFVAIALTTGFVYSTPFVVIGFLVADDALVEPCNPATAYEPHLMVVWTDGYVSIAVIVVLLNIDSYFLLVRSRKKHGMPQNNIASHQRQAQVTNSLLVMMVAYSLTTLLASTILFISNLLRIEQHTIDNISSFVCLLVLLNYGKDYYILFWRSRIYRTIFLNQLHLKSKAVISVAQVTEVHAKPEKSVAKGHRADQLTKERKHGTS